MPQQDKQVTPGVGLGLTCPACGEFLKVTTSAPPHAFFGCARGHRYTQNELLRLQTEEMRRNLEDALRAGEEKAVLLRKIAEQARKKGHPDIASLFQKDIENLEIRARIIEATLRRDEGIITADPGAPGQP